jgi:hypothetical protein
VKTNKVKVQRLERNEDGKEVKVFVEKDIKEIEESLKCTHLNICS